MHLDTGLPRILAVQGASRALSHVAITWRACGLRIAGAVEEFTYEPQSARETVVLRDVRTGARYPLKQDLGTGSTSCALDTAGLAAACFAIETAIEEGCDFVIISKFGKLEAERGGLAGAFYAAIEANAPILTSVAPALTQPWNGFANPLSMFVQPDYGVIETWRHDLAKANLTA